DNLDSCIFLFYINVLRKHSSNMPKWDIDQNRCMKFHTVLQENSSLINQCWVSPSQNFMDSFQLLRIKIWIDCMT
ncbi:hypothetical protein L9F63_006068, partial [Diploptera punctata]